MKTATLVLGLACLIGFSSAARITRNKELLDKWAKEGKPEVLYDPFNTTLPDPIPLPASSAWVELVSWKPRVYIWHNFITDEEARHLIDLAAPQMKRSTVVGEGGKSVEDNYRTSYGTFLRRYQVHGYALHAYACCM